MTISATGDLSSTNQNQLLQPNLDDKTLLFSTLPQLSPPLPIQIQQPSSHHQLTNKSSYSSIYSHAHSQSGGEDNTTDFNTPASSNNVGGPGWLGYRQSQNFRQQGFAFGEHHDGKISPPSPSTIDSTNDSLGGDFAPPSISSSPHTTNSHSHSHSHSHSLSHTQSIVDAHNHAQQAAVNQQQQQQQQQAYRARSVSQPNPQDYLNNGTMKGSRGRAELSSLLIPGTSGFNPGNFGGGGAGGYEGVSPGQYIGDTSAGGGVGNVGQVGGQQQQPTGIPNDGTGMTVQQLQQTHQDYYYIQAYPASNGATTGNGSGFPMEMGSSGEGGSQGQMQQQQPPQQMVDENGNVNMDAYLPDGTLAGPNVRYGYRMPQSQPSSPVRSGFPPGMAPYSAQLPQGGQRPRSTTVSGGMGYHPAVYGGEGGQRMTQQQQQQQQQQEQQVQAPVQQGLEQLRNSPYTFSPQDSPLLGGQTSGGVAGVAGSGGSGGGVTQSTTPVNLTPFLPQQMQMTSIVASGSPMPHLMMEAAQQQALSLPYNPGMNVDMSDQSLVGGTVAHLEAQAQAQAQAMTQYGLGMGDISMEPTSILSGGGGGGGGNSMVMSNQPSSLGHSVTNSASGMDDVMDSSRRSSMSNSGGAGGVMMPGFTSMSGSGGAVGGGAQGMMSMQAVASGSTDLSSHVHEKLSLIESIMVDANAAKVELLRGHGGAADDRLSDITSRLMGSPVSAGPSASQAPSLPAIHEGTSSPAPPFGMDSSTPVQTPLSGNSALAPPFELSRPSSSTKRPAPESPVLDPVASAVANKHARLAEDGGVAQSSQSGQSNQMISEEGSGSTLAPPVPQMVHSHSYPNAHLSPSQQTTAPTTNGLTITMPTTPVPTTSAGFAAGLNLGHAPHVPSPLSNIAMTSRPASPTGGPSNASYFNVHTMQSNTSWEQPSPYSQTPMYTQEQSDVFVPVLSRRGSIVDGRLISGRPGPAPLSTSGDNRAATSGVIPTMTSLNRSGSNGADRQGWGRAGGGGDDDDSDSDDDGSPRPRRRRRSSPDGGGGGGGGSAPAASTKGKLVLPQALVSGPIKSQLDRIMFEFLNKVCSKLDFKDSKGELLHQALMPKKMARLDESPDFRPFKFRIQAFTNAFHEELQQRGVMDETLSAKKVKSYLWTHNLISRFNDDGKKSKSKGNHIWNVDAKKLHDGSWVFREFRRKIAGTPSPVAAIGDTWSWAPRVWDPQASTSGLNVHWSSPEGSLPRWLEWRGNVLSGTPIEGDGNADVTVIATFLASNDDQLQLSASCSIQVVMPSRESAAPAIPRANATQGQHLSFTPAGYGMDMEENQSIPTQPNMNFLSPGPYADPPSQFNQYGTTDHDMDSSSAGLYPPSSYGMLPSATSSLPVLGHSQYDPTQPPDSANTYYSSGSRQ